MMPTQTDEALREAEDRYRLLVDSVDDYAIFALDPHGAVMTWNVGAERIKGYASEEIIGENFSRFFTPDDLAMGRPQQILDLVASAGRHEEQGMRVRKDGSQFLAHLTFTALRDSSGVLRGFAEFSHDISKSEDSALRYLGLLEAAPDAMVVVNEVGNIVLVNMQAEKQFGFRRDELLGQSVTRIIPHGFAERLVADALRSIEDALRQQIGTGVELVGHRKNGSEFPIEIMLSPHRGLDGVLVTAAIRDITTRKKAEAHLQAEAALRVTVEELRRSNLELEQFAYIASHDLQEPLRMIASYTQLLSKRYTGKLDAQADEFIAFAVDGAKRMQLLIRDLLEYSRVGTTRDGLSTTSSEDALGHALANLHDAIEDGKAIVTHDALPSVYAQPTQLVQLLQNLIGNGIKYQAAGPARVHISSAPNAEGRVAFSVRDNGVGIAPQYFERIFGMFQRLHKREEFAGTGIGLAICKKIVERHGGQMSVQSMVGEGSTFQFTLAPGERAA
ncbi:MAG: PAS domain S-box protein [Kofleriaceae bacterium]